VIVVGDERGDGGDDEDGAETLDHRPAEEEHLHVQAERGDE
jgi:hypothetical protein